MRAEFRIICKNDMIMGYVSHYCLKKFIASKNNTEFKKDIKIRVHERALGALKAGLDKFMTSWEKEMGDDIRAGKIDIENEFLDKGGIVIFKLQGSPEEIDVWTKIGIKDKIALRSMKKWIEIKVIK